MKKQFIIFLIILLLLSILGGSGLATGERSKPPRNIVLIGWDGAQRNHVKESLIKGELPNLKNLSLEGRLVAIDISRRTDTKAGWAQILTGYEPEVTGVFSNKNYGPIPVGFTIFERLEEFFGKDKFVTVAVIGKREHLGYAPKHYEPVKQKRLSKKRNEGLIKMENGSIYRIVPAEPYYHTREKMDVFINGLRYNADVGNKTLDLLGKYKDKPFFFFVHFAELDSSGHKYGENSKEYNEALKSDDYWTGKIMEKLKELKLYDDTLIYITSDHGFDERGIFPWGIWPMGDNHNDAPYVFLATNDPLVIRRGEREDIAPTILKRFGLDLTKIQPSLDGHPLTEAYEPPIW